MIIYNDSFVYGKISFIMNPLLSNLTYQRTISDVAEYLKKQNIASELNGKKLLVVGATGLIGTFLIDVLSNLNRSENANIYITAVGRNKEKLQSLFSAYLNQDGFKIIPHDIKEPLSDYGNFDYIINAASNTHPVAYSTDPVGTITTNVFGTYNLLEYARNHNIKRFMFLSSVEIYGEDKTGNSDFLETEIGFIDCNTARAGYPESKRVCESLCQAYIQKYDMDIVIPRICRVYGPTMLAEDSKALAQFIRNAVNGQDIILKSEGNQYYSYITVFDCITALLTILVNGQKGQAYNVSSAKSNITLKDLTEKLASKAGTKVVFQLPNETEKQGFSKATRAILNNTKLLSLGWTELYDIDKGIEITLETIKGTLHD